MTPPNRKSTDLVTHGECSDIRGKCRSGRTGWAKWIITAVVIPILWYEISSIMELKSGAAERQEQIATLKAKDAELKEDQNKANDLLRTELRDLRTQVRGDLKEILSAIQGQKGK